LKWFGDGEKKVEDMKDVKPGWQNQGAKRKKAQPVRETLSDRE
jgi:hypothetical protein